MAAQRATAETDQLASLNATAATVTNQNALLARLTSLSSSFKSIFVRPKSARHVSYDRFAATTASSTLVSTNGSNEKRETEFKLRLFSTNAEINTNSGILKKNLLLSILIVLN